MYIISPSKFKLHRDERGQKGELLGELLKTYTVSAKRKFKLRTITKGK